MADGGQAAATLAHYAVLHQLGQVLVDVPVAAAVLVLGVAPLLALPPFVVGRGAEQHRLRRGRTDPVASDAAAGSGLVEAALAEQARQGDAELLVHGEVATKQPDLPVLAVVPVHPAVPVLLVVGRNLVDQATIQIPVAAADLDPLARVPLRLLLVAFAVRAAAVRLARGLRQGSFGGAEGPTLKQPGPEAFGLLHGDRRLRGLLMNSAVGTNTALGYGRGGRGHALAA